MPPPAAPQPAESVSANPAACPPWCTRQGNHGVHHAATLGVVTGLATQASVAAAQQGAAAPTVKVWVQSPDGVFRDRKPTELLDLPPADAVVLADALASIESWEDFFTFRRALRNAARVAQDSNSPLPYRQLDGRTVTIEGDNVVVRIDGKLDTILGPEVVPARVAKSFDATLVAAKA